MTVVGIYQDLLSGAKAKRPGLNRLMGDASAGMFDCVLVWRLDRFGRSLQDCLTRLDVLEGCSIRFIAITQGLDTDQRDPGARFILPVLGAAAQFERALILERMHDGRMRYQQNFESGRVGKTVHSQSGRDLPPHRPRKDFSQDAVFELRRQGYPMRAIAKQLNIGLGTVSRTLGGRSKSCFAEKDESTLMEAVRAAPDASDG